jgi:hypothetical protein
MNWELQLARPMRTHRCGLPEVVRTLGDALDLIDEHLPETLRFQPSWREVKEKLVAAAETRTGRAVGRLSFHQGVGLLRPSIKGLRRALTEEERRAMAKSIVEHLKLWGGRFR